MDFENLILIGMNTLDKISIQCEPRFLNNPCPPYNRPYLTIQNLSDIV